MKLIKLYTTLSAMALGMTVLAAGARVEGEVLVRFKPSYQAYGGAVHQRIGARVTGGIPKLGYVKVQLPFGIDTDNGIAYYRNHPYVQEAYQNGIKRALYTPNDPQYKNQWHYPIMQVDKAWDLTKGSPNIIVAVIDTGVDKDHPDLAPKLMAGRDFVNNDLDADDDQGHGTHCAGTVGAATNNGIGVSGVAINTRIMPVKVLSADGFGTDEWIINGMIWAADNGAHILSMSLGGYGTTAAEAQAVDYVTAKGKLIVSASGNDGITAKSYPAAYPKVLAVGGTTSTDNAWQWSNHGKDWVDVAAPSEGVLSTTIGGGYGLSDGTSMAAPHVAGVAALVWSVYGVGGKAADVRRQIELNCDNPNNVRARFAYGRVNAFRAIPRIAYEELKYNGTSISKLEGGTASGSVASITASDNTYFTLPSVAISRTGQVSSSAVSFTVPTNVSSMDSFYIKFEGHATSYANVLVFAKDYQTGSWTYLNAQPSGNADATRNVTLSRAQVSKFINPTTRRLDVLLRVVAPDTLYRPATPFTSRWDFVQAGAFLTP